MFGQSPSSRPAPKTHIGFFSIGWTVFAMKGRVQQPDSPLSFGFTVLRLISNRTRPTVLRVSPRRLLVLSVGALQADVTGTQHAVPKLHSGDQRYDCDIHARTTSSTHGTKQRLLASSHIIIIIKQEQGKSLHQRPRRVQHNAFDSRAFGQSISKPRNLSCTDYRQEIHALWVPYQLALHRPS